MDSSLTEPVTGERYSLKHLHPRYITYKIKIDSQPKEVTLRVHFSNHCYTRTRDESDSDEAVISTERKRNGVIEERVFCPDRWNFSLSLPEIIQGLHHKGCLIGGSMEIFYRQENPQQGNPHEGWYICARLGISDNYQNLTMSVRSVHYRSNRPADIRHHGPTRFYVILSKYYSAQRERRDWLS